MNIKKESVPWDVSESMTVGEVIARYPEAAAALEGLCRNQRFERYDCLDEVAWRHGMESGELLGRLQEELARGVPGMACRRDVGVW